MSDSEESHSSYIGSDNDSDNEIEHNDVAIDENGNIVAVIPPLSQFDQTEHVNEISVNGVDSDTFSQFSSQIRYSAKQCQICCKYYPKDMVTKVDNELQCYHCIFWMNYSPETRAFVDGVFGLTISDYILKCYTSHDTESCTRNIPDYGGCFLCDFINKVPIFNIIDVEKILCLDETVPQKESTIFDDDFVLEV